MKVVSSVKGVAAVLVAFAVFSPELLCQRADEIENAQARVRMWQNQTDDFTKEVVAESSSVNDWERSTYFALLASMWWKDDEKRAQSFLKNAADKLITAWRTDDKTDESQKVKFAQKTIQIVSKFNPKGASSLASEIVRSIEDSDKLRPSRENTALADLLVNLGLQVIGSDSEIALLCGKDSLNFGVSSSLPQLIAELHATNESKAEILYGKVMLKVRGNFSQNSLLFFSNFAKFLFDIPAEKPFTPSIRSSFLTAYADLVTSAILVESERPAKCRVTIYAGQVAGRVDEFLPHQSLAFRHSLQTCLTYLPNSLQGVAEAAQKSDSIKTVDEYVRAAKGAKEKTLKLRYWREALSRLQNAKQHTEIISLLDSVDGDYLKELAPIVWDDWRIDAAFQTVLIALEEKDLSAAYRIIDRTPKKVRTFVRYRIANKLRSDKPTHFYSDNLDELSKELESLELASKDVANFYKKLSELYITVRPSDSEKMFSYAVKYINKADAENPDFTVEKDWAPRQDYVPLSATLLEIDETNILSSLNKISSRRSRVRLKLGFLESSLKKLQDAKKSLDQLQKNKKDSATRVSNS